MLTLRLLSVDGQPPPYPEERTVKQGRLAIGRGAENDWVLQDPGRVLSKQHCTVEVDGRRAELFDTSTNGVFHNDHPEAVGRGGSVLLAEGDRFRIGRYVFRVSLGPAEEEPLSRFDSLFNDPPPAAHAKPQPFAAHSFAPLPPEPAAWAPASAREPTGRPADAPRIPDWGRDGGEEEDLLAGPSRRAWSGGDTFDNERLPNESDAFRAPKPAAGGIPDDFNLDPAAPEPSSPPAPTPTRSPAPSANGSVIPDDWDDLLGDEPPAAAPRPAAAAPVAPVATIPDDEDDDPLYPAPARPAEASPVFSPPAAVARAPEAVAPAAAPVRTAADGERLIRAFLEGAGIDIAERGDDEAFMRNAGRILRESVGGLAEILAARDMVKAEFRVARTMIQADNNNPLKLSPTVEEKLTRVLAAPERGYMAGLPAVSEAVRDVRAHELALLAGLQVALKGLIQKFDPDRLKDRLGDSGFLGGLFGAQKARYWEAYELLYDSIAKDVEDDFQEAYGQAVAEEYQQRLYAPEG